MHGSHQSTYLSGIPRGSGICNYKDETKPSVLASRCAATRLIAIIGALLLTSVTIGCGSLATHYGDSSGRNGEQSLNGFGAFRQAFKNAGFEHRDVSRLSNRVLKNDVLVWTPSNHRSFDPQVTRWLEQWLAQGDRTLVFVIPDSGSEADYWLDASKLAPPEQRLEYRRRAARSINQRMQWRLNRSTPVSNGWFVGTPLPQSHTIEQLGGSWAGAIGEELDGSHSYTVEWAIEPDANGTSAPPTTAAAANQNSTGPVSPQSNNPPNSSITSTPVSMQPRLQDQSGTVIVAEMQSKQWSGSQIIVVGGGSLLTNYAFTKPFPRSLADQIVSVAVKSTTSSTPRAGFISIDAQSLPVSESKPGVPKASGWELLTTWPMSLVTVHAALLGLVICLMLLPSLGRARHVRYHAKGNFGDHLDAVATLMNRAGGEGFARHRISEYMRRIHGETQGPWVLAEPEHATASGPPPLETPSAVSHSPGLPAKPTAGHTHTAIDTHSSLDPTDSDTTANS